MNMMGSINLKLLFYTFGFLYFLNIIFLIKNEIDLSSIWNFCSTLINSELNWIVYFALFNLNYNLSWIFLLVFINLDYFNFVIWINYSAQITSTLTNGFFLIHPIFIFLMYLIALQLIILNKINNVKSLKFSILSISAIFLGGWWANQELGWGGWWSWDLVEIINLILILLGIQKLHERKKIPNLKKKKLNSIIGLLFFHLCIRYDLFNSIHAFTTIFMLEYISLIVCLLIILNMTILYNEKYFVLEINNAWTKFIIFIYIISIIIYDKNIANNQLVWQIYLFFLLNLLFWYSFKTTNKISIFYSSYNFFYCAILLIWNFFKKFQSKFLHFILGLVLFIFMIKNQLNYIYEYIYVDNTYSYINGDFTIIKAINSVELWFNMNILNEKYLNNITYIVFYNYIMSLKLFLTTNFNNFSYFNYYFDLGFITYIIVVAELLKNVINLYTKYRIWRI